MSWAKFALNPIEPIKAALPLVLSIAYSASVTMSSPYISPTALMAIATIHGAPVISPTPDGAAVTGSIVQRCEAAPHVADAAYSVPDVPSYAGPAMPSPGGVA